MSILPDIQAVESKYLKKKVPTLQPGDIIRVHQRIREAGKERIQIFEGVVIGVKGGAGMAGTFTVRRIASGVGVERTYPLHSPKVAKIERVKSSQVNRAKLYYLRERIGRKGRLRGEAVEKEVWEESAEPEVSDKVETEEPTPEAEETAEAEDKTEK